jgi:RHS repeat-associated protein
MADGADNNGNLVSQVMHVATTNDLNTYTTNFTIPDFNDYTYDSLNRLTNVLNYNMVGNAGSYSWNHPFNQKFQYDRWGNRTIDNAGTWGQIPNPVQVIEATTNRLTNISGTPLSYDPQGNQTNGGSGERLYDAENRMTKAVHNSGPGQYYYYNAEGQRTRRIVNGEEWWMVYGFDGELVAEYKVTGGSAPAPTSPVKEYIYREGQVLVVSEQGNAEGRKLQWLVHDQLGTPRMIFDTSGRLHDDPATTNVVEGVRRHDYLPFGEENVYNAAGGSRTAANGYVADGVRQQFAGYERDSETGLDFAGARYFSAVQGRFTSADNFLNDTQAVDPSSWNLYAYVRNNPLRYTDPTGEKIYAGGLSQADQDELLKRTNYTYGCQSCVSVDKDGYLAVDTSGLSKQVAGATQYLTDAINSTDYFAAVAVSNNDKSIAFGQNLENGTTVTFNGQKRVADKITLDFGDDKAVSGNKDAAQAFLYTVFAHEVAHGYPRRRSDPAEGGSITGPVVDAVNLILQARGLPLRERYSASPAATYWAAVPHGYADRDKKTGQIKYQGSGIKVKEETKLVVRWVRSMVGGRGIN